MGTNPRTNNYSYRIPVFDGGLNTKYTDVNTPPNQATDLQNVQFGDYGSVGTIPGYTVYNPVAIASAVIDGLHSLVDNSSGREMLAACNGSIWRASGNTFVVIASSVSQYTAGQDAQFVTIDGEAWVTNGYIKPYRWDGTNFFQVGVSAPVSGAASAACSGVGNLNGDYIWYMTGVNSAGAEGDYAAITSAAVTIASGEVTVNGIYEFPTSAGVDYKNIYRNTAGVAGIPYLVTSVTNAITAYTDNIADGSLVTEPPSDNGTPPACKYMVYYRGRVFGAGDPNYPMRVWFSNQGDPEIWPSTNYIDVNAGDGEEIRGIRIYGNSLVIHKNDGKGRGSIWLLFMPDTQSDTDATGWTLFKSPSAYGAQGNKAIAFFNNLMLFLNRYGVYAFTGEDIAMSAADSSVGKFAVDSHSFDIEPDILDISSALIEGSCAITYDNKVWLAVPKGGSATENNTIYTYDFILASEQDRSVGAWSKITAPSINCFTEHDGDLYGGSGESDGFVYKLNTGTDFNGGAIDSYFTTISIAGLPEHTDYTKVWRYLEFMVSTPGDWNLAVTYWVDFFDDSGLTTNYNLNVGQSLWGTMVWGEDNWNSGGNRIRARIVLQNAVGKNIKFKFRTNGVDNKFDLYDLELKYMLRRIR